MSVLAPEITSGGTNPPEVISTADFTELLFDGKSSDAAVTFNGDTVVEGTKIIDSTFTVDSGKSVFQTTKIKDVEVVAESGSTLNAKVSTGVVKSTKFTGNDGDDTVKFGGKTTIKGKVKVDLGEGANTTVIKSEIDGKIVIKNFDDDDTIIFNGETFTVDKDNLDELADEGIKIKFKD